MTGDELGTDLSPPTWPITDERIRGVFEALVQDGSWGRYHGPHCDRLRDALAEFHSVSHVILCSSGTSAVELALRAAKVQPGDEVILAAYDYKANFANVLTLQATPVLVDTLHGIPALDPAQLEHAITNKTRAVVCSHLHGSFARMTDIQRIAAAHDIVVIEDACQAAGAKLNGQPAGAIGDVGVLSFGGSKLLTAGRGGAVLTNDDLLAQRIRLHTQRGNDAYPLSEMQAAVLLPQLQQLPQRTNLRFQNVVRLIQQLSSNSPVQPVESIESAESDNRPAFYKLVLRYCPRDGEAAITREQYAAGVRRQGIALDPGFPALHKIHSARRFRSIGALPNASNLHDQLMTLHHPVLLQGASEIDRLATILNQAVDSP